MAASNRNNTANGIISLIVVLCGVIFSALIGVLFKKAVEGSSLLQSAESSITVDGSSMNSAIAYSSSPLWSLGFAFIVPGIIGAISAIVKNKGVYITHMVFCIISLLVMGIFFIMAFFSLGILTTMNPTSDDCYDVNNKCKCGGSSSLSDFDSSDSSFGSSFGSSLDSSFDYSCGDLKAMYGMGIGIVLMIILGWIFTLVTTVLSGILACRNESQPGVIIQRQPATTTVVQLAPVAGMPPQITYAPPTHDHAQLVHNMEY